MKTLKMQMSLVKNCKISECAYNTNQLCHARAVTIGDGCHPCCDTFFQSGKHSNSSHTAGVGACKVSICKHNQDWECQADSIEVKQGECPATCATFCKR
jgi:hypothetical protein